MLKERRQRQQQMDLVILEQLIPENHLLRKVEHAVDFSFIYPLCAPLYSQDNGRPAIDPEVLFRMLFIGYLYGIKSEARLEEEINYNMAYKWFCGLKLTEKAPDASTNSKRNVIVNVHVEWLLATGDIRTRGIPTGSTVSNTTMRLTHTSARRRNIFTGKRRHGTDNGNTSATAKFA